MSNINQSLIDKVQQLASVRAEAARLEKEITAELVAASDELMALRGQAGCPLPTPEPPFAQVGVDATQLSRDWPGPVDYMPRKKRRKLKIQPGKYGRNNPVPEEVKAKIRELKAAGNHTNRAICEETGIGQATLHRILHNQ